MSTGTNREETSIRNRLQEDGNYGSTENYSTEKLVEDLSNSAVKYFKGDENLFNLKDAMGALEQRYEEEDEAPLFVERQDYDELEGLLRLASMYEKEVSGAYVNPPEIEHEHDLRVSYWGLEL